MTAATNATKSTRRSARITAAYVAIHLDYISASTDIIPCKANKPMHIEGVNGASVDLEAGEHFFLHRAASLGENMFYVVREVVGEKRCSCPARKPCKHEIAVQARRPAKVTASQELYGQLVAAAASLATRATPTKASNKPLAEASLHNGRCMVTRWGGL